MKQEQESSSTGTTEAAGTDKEVQPVKPVKPAKPVKPPGSRPQKNLYEPYNIPPILYHAIRWFVIFVYHIVARIRLRGLYNVPKKGAFIIASNHLSWTDIPLIPFHLPRKVVYMAKEEYFNSRLAWLVRFLGAFPVKRGEGDRQALRAGEEQLKKGNILVIFPEGTRSRTRTMARAHSGMGMIALRTGVPVVPVAIWGSENMLKKFGAPVTISFGEPMVLTPKGKKITREDIDEATDKVMRKIAEMLPPEYRGVYGSSHDAV
ncbi:MAG: 1-acyl-sn-glycerol-3-phosphate acyltransferase [Chloroflexi bacterium]|nr:MAG: 1-acyl-sn-glycerol-3-phosphate acyltransferase [Chloroflexota bacterium]